MKDLLRSTLQNAIKTNLIAFSGVVKNGDSGLPVYDQSGKVWGIIVGSDTTSNLSYAVPTEWILKFVAENIDEVH